VVSAPDRQCFPAASQLCQDQATSKLSRLIPRGSRGARQRRPVAVTAAPSLGTPEMRSVPWCPGGGMAAACAAGAAAGIQVPSETRVMTAVAAATRASLVIMGQLRKAGGSRSRWAANRSSHMATACVVVSVAAVFGSSRAAW
jgi:hypothetical protein